MTRTAYRSGATLVALCFVGLLAVACTGQDASSSGKPTSTSTTEPVTSGSPGPPTTPSATGHPQSSHLPPPFHHRIPGMPAPVGADVYGAAGRNMLSDATRHDPAYLYVPN